MLVDNVVPLCAESRTQHLLVQREGFCRDSFLLLCQQYTHLLELLAGFLSSEIDHIRVDRITLCNGAEKKGFKIVPIRLCALLWQYIVMLFLIPQKFFHISK